MFFTGKRSSGNTNYTEYHILSSKWESWWHHGIFLHYWQFCVTDSVWEVHSLCKETTRRHCRADHEWIAAARPDDTQSSCWFSYWKTWNRRWVPYHSILSVFLCHLRCLVVWVILSHFLCIVKKYIYLVVYVFIALLIVKIFTFNSIPSVLLCCCLGIRHVKPAVWVPEGSLSGSRLNWINYRLNKTNSSSGVVREVVVVSTLLLFFTIK